MKTASSQTLRTTVPRILAILVMSALLSSQFAVVLGLHWHALPDGTLVVHSHPVEKSRQGKGQHQHSSQEYTCLQIHGKLLPSLNPELNQPIPPLHQNSVRLDCHDPITVASLILKSSNKRSPPDQLSA